MRQSLLITTPILGIAGCLDLSSLQSGNGQDMAIPTPDMAMPAQDMAMPPTQDMTLPLDLQPPVDLLPPPPTNWNIVASATQTGVPLNAIMGVAGALADTIYAVGDKGAVVAGDGTTFANIPSPGVIDLTALWVPTPGTGLQATEVWVAGQGGNVLQTVNTGVLWAAPNAAKTNVGFTLRGIFAANNDNKNVVSVGDSNNTVIAFNGTTWASTNHNSGQKLLGVWAGGSVFYAVGEKGESAFSGVPSTSWTKNTTLTSTSNLNAVSGLDDANVWAVSSGGELVKYNSGMKQWDPIATATGTPILKALWVNNANEIWVAGTDSKGKDGAVQQCDSVAKSCVDKGNSNLTGVLISGIWGDAKGGVWVTATKGKDGVIAKF